MRPRARYPVAPRPNRSSVDRRCRMLLAVRRADVPDVIVLIPDVAGRGEGVFPPEVHSNNLIPVTGDRYWIADNSFLGDRKDATGAKGWNALSARLPLMF